MRQKLENLLRWSEKYTGTDMVYAAKGGFWLILGKGVVFAVSFLKMIAFGRFVPQDIYGTYNFIIAAVGIFVIFSLPGVDTAIIRSISRKKDDTLRLALKEKLKYSLIGSAGILILSLWYFIGQNYELGMSFLIAGAVFPFFYSFTIFSSFWIGKKRFDVQNKYEMASSSLIAISVITVLYFTNNIIFIAAAFFISESLFNGVFLKKTFGLLKNKGEDKEAISFGKSLTIMSAIGTFANQIDKIIIWKFLGPIQLAIYSFALLPAQKMIALVPISFLALPKLGESGLLDGRKEGIISKTKKLFFVSVPLAAFLAFAAPLIYRIFFPAYMESVPYFQLFAFLILLSPLHLPGASLISQIKKRELYAVNITVPVLKILLFAVLAPIWGIWGITVAIIIAQATEGLMVFYYFKKI